MDQRGACDFAVKHGYAGVIYLCKWRNYHCYEPILEAGKIAYIGKPKVILEDNEGNFRMSTGEEGLMQIHESAK